MHILYRTVLWLDWLIACAWLVRVITWHHLIKMVPDLTEDLTRDLTKIDVQDVPRSRPRLSVIVPARNEAECIAATLDSLLQCRGVKLEIIAVDDRSEDETGAIIDRIKDRIGDRASAGVDPAAAEVTLRVLHVHTLPPGWLGKTHAMALASRYAGGEWLLFTDGDVLFREDTLRRALAFAAAGAADHFVLMPTLILKSWGERMMLAFLTGMTIWAVRPWRVAAKRDAIGVGAFNMIRRDVYDAIGGWEALRMEVVEDLALGVRIKRRGFQQRVAFGRGLVSVRWAHGARGVVGNMTKNLFAVLHYRWERVLGLLIALALLTLFPLVAVIAGGFACAATGVMLFAVWLDYRHQSKYQPFSAWQLVLFPAASAMMMYAICRSTFIVMRDGGISWRGTFYSLRELRGGSPGL